MKTNKQTAKKTKQQQQHTQSKHHNMHPQPVSAIELQSTKKLTFQNAEQ